MIGNYFKTALRNILKHKSYSLINIIGLSIGIACFVLIGLYIADEMSYDRYHEKSDRIYRVVNVYDFDGVGENSASAPFPVAFTLKNEYPGLIKNVVRIFDFQVSRSLVEYKDKSFNEKNLFFADSTFFDIFDYKFVKGDPETALQEANSVVITETAARKYFGDEEPMGKVLRYDDRVNLKVTGLIRDVPLQSHFQFSLVASMSTVRQITRGQLPRTWVWNPCWTYVLLKEGVVPEEIEKDLPNYVNKFFYDAEKENISLYLQPLEDIHLKSKLDYEIEPNNDIGNLYILAVIAFFLLVIAAINFMNLATATSTGRSKEIGIKKVVGAYRKQIIRQFLGESILMSFFAMIVALFLIELALPAFNDFTGKEISLSLLVHPVYMGALLLITLLTGFLSGVYPAFYLSSFKPVQVLKGKVSKGAKSGKSRKVLVVMQFAISIALIISTFIAYDQISYIRNADLGFKNDDIIIVPINRTNIAEGFKEFKNELQNNPDIYSVTAMDDILGKAHNTHEFRPEGYPEDKWNFYPALVVHYDFLKTFDIKVIAGRDYSELHKTDPMKGLLINEAMVRHLGWECPEKALGKKLITIRGDERVIGVTENFNVTSLHQPAGPFALNMKEEDWSIHWFTNFMVVRHIPGKEKEVLAYLEKKWKEREGERPFEYSFLEDELSQLYEGEEKLGSLSLIFAVLIIFIASLGLFGLASFMAEQRTKEIGIRKVLGAQTLSIIKLMSFDFMKLVLIATLISWPLSYIFMDNWLENFAYRTQINLPAFVLAALIALTIAMSITSVKAYFASQTDPVDILKYE
ncbi:MAG: ABC transporter permease [Bacteroidales bacterium]|nr:ABC transporter permease [Bacteroidales bacterium]MCF8343902.1 ABC transporter permease [Bacteroidales bacterium]MCF8350887.1 ABC transporter permease [Bacteroidales bacterium]MCF8376909.1 ABC transporter permease [Bacteroidales bacterium]MCF8400822.1 ABC transporter permease [Bacteroidales bacterium]